MWLGDEGFSDTRFDDSREREGDPDGDDRDREASAPEVDEVGKFDGAGGGLTFLTEAAYEV